MSTKWREEEKRKDRMKRQTNRNILRSVAAFCLFSFVFEFFFLCIFFLIVILFIDYFSFILSREMLL